MYDSAIEILKKINKLGYESYIIGGYTRDLLLGVKSNDIDITTSAKPDVIKEMFEVVADNTKFGSLKIKYKSYIFEITTFRIELEYSSRYPKIKYTNSLKKDLIRRDFTINTICIDENEKIIDLLNGKEDLENKTIKSIGDVDIKLKEDPIRILRAIRLAGKLNFKLEDALKNSIIKNSYLLKNISKNIKQNEIDKMNEEAKKILRELNVEVFI